MTKGSGTVGGRALKICNHPGCQRAIEAEERYCSVHKPLHTSTDSGYVRPERHAFYNTSQWRKIRAAYIHRHPLCEQCLRRGVIVEAAVVDHIREIKDGGSRTDTENLQSLCRYCHAEKTAEEKKKRCGGRGA
ncbi:MAG: HNH endonuclease signature motif containing protein [Synergistaceae bacterium]|nr:HNH endonuclease signature motif containing protein [Synergistaceae bacterium]